jgi:azurin
MKNRTKKLLPAIVLALGVCTPLCPAADPPPAVEVPHILLDKSPRIVEYQLKRLSNAQLLLVERKTDSPKYIPVYEAILTRKGIDKKSREEAVAALATLKNASPVVVVLEAIGKVDPEDKTTPRDLSGILMSQKPADLVAQRDKIQSLATDSESDTVKQSAYAALAVADGKPDAAWQLASSKDNLKQLLGGISLIKDKALRGAFFPLANPLVDKAADEATQVAAVEAISSIPGHEAETFKELAGLISTQKGAVRDAAVMSIRRIPVDKWPDDQVEPLANAIIKLVGDTPAADRTNPATAQAVQLGNDLADSVAPEKGQAIRKKLRELAVQVVVIRAMKEQMIFDTKYFAVQAGKPVEIILQNDDAMPHNLVITQPKAFQAVAALAGAMPPPTEDSKKAYIPDSPQVIDAVSMVQQDNSATMTLTAPKTPGEYDFVCTFPGHSARMYGVMLVVPDLDAWDLNPKPPTDPLSGKPYDSQKNEDTVGGGH